MLIRLCQNVFSKSSCVALQHVSEMKAIKPCSTLLCLIAMWGVGQCVAIAQTELDRPTMDSELSEAVKNDKSILSTAFGNVGSKLFGGAGDESAMPDSTSSNHSRNALNGVKQIEGAYEYTSWAERSPFMATGALAFELGIGVEDLLAEDLDEVANEQRKVEIVNVLIENSRQPEPLEYFDAPSLAFKGLFTNSLGQQVALIASPDGGLYKATVGDRVGLSQAKVAQINGDEIVLVTGSIVNRIPLTVAAEF